MQGKELILRRELEEESSEQLRMLLQMETGKAVPDDDLVLAILHILEDREPEDQQPSSDREEAAWQLYRKRVKARKKRKPLLWKCVAKAAVLLLIAGLLLAAIPGEAQARNWWDRIARWTDDFFAFFREEETFRIEEFEFRTDNPGLQQVYDAVMEMGVTDPVVPMWLPEGYELSEIEVHTVLNEVQIVARFESLQKAMIYQTTILATDVNTQFPKDATSVIIYEKNNTIYNIMINNGMWIVAWIKDNIECSIFVDCQEDDLFEILDSIYRWREY